MAFNGVSHDAHELCFDAISGKVTGIHDGGIPINLYQ